MTAILTLIGPVRLTAASGHDATPRGLRTRAALALIATAPAMRLSRAALQDRLWSTRDQRQGSDSLRQMLRELRACAGSFLAPAPDGFVAFDPDRLRLDLTPGWDLAGAPLPFAADLDPLRDPEFEDWLRDMRLRLDPEEPAAGPMVIRLDPVLAADPADALAVEILLAEAAAQAADWLPARLLAGASPTAAELAHGLRLRAVVSRAGDGRLILSAIVGDLAGAAPPETRRLTVAGPGTPPAAVLVADLVALLIAAGQRADRGGAAFPLADTFSFSPARLARADRTLAARQDGPSGAVALALRSWLRHTRTLERLDADPESVLAEASAQIAQALSRAPQNPTVLAIAALQAAMRFHTGAALELAQRAVAANRDSDLAAYAMSFALTEAGRNADALDRLCGHPGGVLATLAPASWHLRRSVAHLRLRDFASAETATMLALAYAPDCRPALRFLLALRAHRHDAPGMAQTLADLRRLEPDFTPAAFLDPDYPAHTLRHAGIAQLPQER